MLRSAHGFNLFWMLSGEKGTELMGKLLVFSLKLAELK